MLWFLNDFGVFFVIVGVVVSLYYGFNMVMFFFVNYLLDFFSYVRVIGMILVIYVVLFLCFFVMYVLWFVFFFYFLVGICFLILWVVSVVKVVFEFFLGGLGIIV